MTVRLDTEPVLQKLADGTRVLFLLPVVPDDAPPEVREGLARRRVAALTGQCPCGETSTHLSRQQRRARQRQQAKRQANLISVTFEHDNDCLACDHRLVPLLRAWLNGEECA